MAIICSNISLRRVLTTLVLMTILAAEKRVCIRIPDQITETTRLGIHPTTSPPLKSAVFALGSFWRSEAVFGCLNGVLQTTVGYAGGSKANPEYRSLGDHAESVQVVYDERLISFRQLLEVFWSSHDYRQVFGQGPDVGNQYRSIVFTNGTGESRLASVNRGREQTKSKSSIVTTQIQPLGTFYPAEPEHQVQLKILYLSAQTIVLRREFSVRSFILNISYSIRGGGGGGGGAGWFLLFLVF
ncbi:putative peptide-methionine (S)-S-oxide reductase [Rosa chinensis]|uniref:peptide-methionine (S)-S-oxide reductase n=1 Tax=Rosa chinensis TaxID=74649 RepID=A0A2P6SQA8_ROSCH|nr:putative peptide-methionine (S)-S-oxide reductase [Rosa chinensis]